MNGIVWVNGKRQATVSVFERALQFGDGLFETLLVRDGQVAFWPLHFQRLSLGLQRLKMAPIAARLLLDDIAKIKRQHCIIKILISRGQSLRGYRFDTDTKPTRIVICNDVPKLKEYYQLSICQVRYTHNPMLAGIKHNNRLEQVLARASIDTDEGVMLDGEGYVISATAANIFIIKDGVIKTPDLSRCGIQGTRRQIVIEKTQAKVAQITLAELLQADEVFLTSTVIGIKKICQIEQCYFSNHQLTDEISL